MHQQAGLGEFELQRVLDVRGGFSMPSRYSMARSRYPFLRSLRKNSENALRLFPQVWRLEHARKSPC